MFKKIKTLIQRRGISYPWYVMQHVLLPKLVFRLAGARRKNVPGSALALLLACPQRPMSLSQLRTTARQLIQANANSLEHQGFTQWSRLPVPAATRRAIEAARASAETHELVIGHIDQDGRLLGKFGELSGLEAVTDVEFVPRSKYEIDVILVDDRVLVRKRFKDHEPQFLREWASLALLAGSANVPSLHRVDERERQIDMDFVSGLTMRDVLAQAGAIVRDGQTDRDPALQRMGSAERERTIRARATKQIPHCFSEGFLEALGQQLEIIHAVGIVDLDIKVGNVIVSSDERPFVIDFENAQIFKSTSSIAYQLKRNNDRERFNHTFGRALVTHRKARLALAQELAREPAWYAPIDFGLGLTVGRYWATDTGAGRWEFFNREVMQPYIQGKTILDLGSNNGIMPLLMLRGGARQVTGIELEAVNVERARLVHKIFEWRDQRSYDFRVQNRNISDIVGWDVDKFDVVTALCSLYYLSAGEMAVVVRKAAQIAPIMIIQANTAPGQEPEKREKASIAFLQKLLVQEGFEHVETIAPPGFSRPILVGQRSHSGSS